MQDNVTELRTLPRFVDAAGSNNSVSSDELPALATDNTVMPCPRNSFTATRHNTRNARQNESTNNATQNCARFSAPLTNSSPLRFTFVSTVLRLSSCAKASAPLSLIALSANCADDTNADSHSARLSNYPAPHQPMPLHDNDSVASDGTCSNASAMCMAPESAMPLPA